MASEARLSTQRRLASSSNEHPFSSGGRVLGFVLPPGARARGQQPPFAAGSASGSTSGRPAGKKAWEEQDDQPDLLDDVGFGVDSGELSSDEENVSVLTPSFGPVDAMGDEMDMDLNDRSGAAAGGLDGDPHAPGSIAAQRRHNNAKWTDFRETRHASVSGGSALMHSRLSASPSAERTLMRGKAGGESIPFGGPASYGTTASEIMEMATVFEETSSLSTSIPGSHYGGRIAKRKAAEERFEPYSSTAHKRRAVSPMHQLSLSIPQQSNGVLINAVQQIAASPRSSGQGYAGPQGSGSTAGNASSSCYFSAPHHSHHTRTGSKVSLPGSRPGSRASSPALTNASTGASTMGSSAVAGSVTRPSTPTTTSVSMMPPPTSSPALLPTTVPMLPTASATGTPKAVTTPGAGSGPATAAARSA